MRLLVVTTLLLSLISTAFATPALMENFLDEYLNNIKIDQSSGRETGSTKDITPEHAVGQTFETGPNVVQIYQIAVKIPSNWRKGTSVVMSLYDDSSKKKKLSEFEMKYEWRNVEDDILVFPMKVDAQGNTTYYFELSTKGENAKASVRTAKANYPNGQAYIDGKPVDFDIMFETYVRTTWDKDKTYQQQFAKFNLDIEGMEKVKAAVEAKDWETAAKELITYYENNPNFIKPKAERQEAIKHHRDPNWDRSYSDLVADMKIRDADGNIISLGPNWNHLRTWPTRGGVGLTRSGIRKDLAHGYFQTGDEKFAKAWTDMLKNFLVDLPSPLKSGVFPPDTKEADPAQTDGGIEGGSMWHGLSIGARAAHGFAYYEPFVDSENFPWDVRAAFIMNLVDMADVLAIYKGGGNWETQMKNGLFNLGQNHPEWARAKDFFEIGLYGLLDNMKTTLKPDGPINESTGYQAMVHSDYIENIAQARKYGFEIPEDIYENIELAAQFHMYTIQPDGFQPSFGDGNIDIDFRNSLKLAAKEFDRPDMLWVATDGKEGIKPEHTSFEFPWSKFYVMRSDWSRDQLFMCLTNGRCGSHGHRDAGSFVMYAYGNPMFIDPGIYIYGTPEAHRLSETRSHSTITVDGRNIINGGGPNSMFIGKGIDYLHAVGPGWDGLDPSIYSVRRVMFLKPDYWIFSDVIHGDGKHLVDSRFHFASNKAELDTETGIAHTTFEKKGNIFVVPVQPQTVSIFIEQGDVAYHRHELIPAKILKQSANVALPFRIDNVLFPYKDEKPEILVTQLDAFSSKNHTATSGIRVETELGEDFIIFTDGPSDVARFSNGVSVRAQSATIRKDTDGKIKSFSWTWGKWLGDNNTLAKSINIIPGLDVVYEDDVVNITTKGSDSSLRIAAMGATTARVNGGPAKKINATNGMFNPFEGNSIPHLLTDDELPGFAVEKPIVGGQGGYGEPCCYCFHWCHTSPGRTSLMTYTPEISENGTYDIYAYIPYSAQRPGMTEDAHYIVKFKPGGRWTTSSDKHINSVDDTEAKAGVIHLRVNQKKAARNWVHLGKYELTPKHAKLEIQADSEVRGPVVVADGVRWQKAN